MFHERHARIGERLADLAQPGHFSGEIPFGAAPCVDSRADLEHRDRAGNVKIWSDISGTLNERGWADIEPPVFEIIEKTPPPGRPLYMHVRSRALTFDGEISWISGRA